MRTVTRAAEWATLALAIWASGSAHAKAPLANTQPGFYRLQLGDFEVTVLNDGVIYYETQRVLPTASPDQIRQGLQRNGLTDPVGMSYNAFLINTGPRLVLIDTGTGGKLDDEPEFHGAGRLLANLAAAGYRAEQIDEVYITHRGQDHIGGLTIGEERTFPNATVVVPKTEFDLFLDPTQSATLIAAAHHPERVTAWVDFTRKVFEPYRRAGKFRTFDADTTLSPGIRAMATHGHTPGHTSYLIESKGQTLLVMGDLVLMGALQFEDPSLGSSFDVDPKAAAEQRERIFKLASANPFWVAGSHLSFPGIGHIQAAGDHYVWIPINYSVPR